MIQAIAKQTLLFVAVLFYFQRLFLGQPDADQMRLGKGNGQQGDQFFNALGVG